MDSDQHWRPIVRRTALPGLADAGDHMGPVNLVEPKRSCRAVFQPSERIAETFGTSDVADAECRERVAKPHLKTQGVRIHHAQIEPGIRRHAFAEMVEVEASCRPGHDPVVRSGRERCRNAIACPQEPGSGVGRQNPHRGGKTPELSPVPADAAQRGLPERVCLAFPTASPNRHECTESLVIVRCTVVAGVTCADRDQGRSRGHEKCLRWNVVITRRLLAAIHARQLRSFLAARLRVVGWLHAIKATSALNSVSQVWPYAPEVVPGAQMVARVHGEQAPISVPGVVIPPGFEELVTKGLGRAQPGARSLDIPEVHISVSLDDWRLQALALLHGDVQII